MCSTQEAGKREAPGVNDCMPEGHAKATSPRTPDALHVDGRTLEGQATANRVHHGRQVLVVSPSSSYYMEGRVGKQLGISRSCVRQPEFFCSSHNCGRHDR